MIRCSIKNSVLVDLHGRRKCSHVIYWLKKDSTIRKLMHNAWAHDANKGKIAEYRQGAKHTTTNEVQNPIGLSEPGPEGESKIRNKQLKFDLLMTYWKGLIMI